MTNPISSTEPNSLSLTATPSQNSPLLKLPSEILVEILRSLSLPEVGMSRLTCKHFYEALQDDFVWKILFRSHFPKVIKEIKGDYQQAYKHQYLLNSNLTNGIYTENMLQSNGDQVQSFIVHDDKLYSGSSDNTIKIWDLNSNQCIATLSGHGKKIYSLALHNGKLCSGSSDGKIKVWDLNSNECIDTLLDHVTAVNSLAIHDGKLYSCSWDGIIKIWDLNSNQCIATLIGHTGAFNSLAIHDGKLYSSSSDGIKIWDLNSNQCIDTLIGHIRAVKSLAIHDGKLYSSSRDGTIKIWDLNSNQCVATLSNERSDWSLSSLLIHEDKLYSACSSTCGSVSVIKIWDLNSNQCIAVLFSDHRSPTATVICSSLAIHKGKLYSGSRLKIWDFTASHDAVFAEIAEQFLDEDPITRLNAAQRFLRMPQTARNKVYGELYLLIKGRLTNDYWGCAEHAFHGKNGQFSTPQEKAQAIRDYLSAETELELSSQLQCLNPLGILTKEECLKKLGCRPGHLQKIGIISAEDLKIICPLSIDVQTLTIEEDSGIQENFRDHEAKQKAYQRQKALSDLSDKLTQVVTSKIQETDSCGVLLYKGECPWVSLQSKLTVFREKFDAIVQQCNDLPKLTVEAFQIAKYNELANELNILVGQFQTLDCDHQIAKLHAYVNQWGILKTWTRRQNEGTQQSLKDLPESERTLQKLFQMGE
jgi:WD40 repeat protein